MSIAVDEIMRQAMADQDADSAVGPRLTAKAASSITPTSPEWVWKWWIIKRGLNLLTARQGVGKTTFAAHVTGVLSRGLALPGDTAKPPLKVGFLSLEEPEDRVVARLVAAGADLDRVVILGDVDDVDDEGRRFHRRWSLPKDIGVLGEAITEHGLSLVIVDGLGYAITGTSHNYAQVGSALAALAGEADRTGAAILGLVHPPKGASDPVTAAIGSTAWTAIPRVAMVMGVDPNDETGATRVVSVGKSNYRKPDSALAFGIDEHPTYECGAVVGLHPTSVTAEEVMATPPSTEEKSERADARSFLREVLADGPMPSVDVERAADAAGVSRTTLKRARRDLGVVARRATDAETGRSTGWTLELPGPEGHSRSVGPLEGRGYISPGQAQRVQRTRGPSQDPVALWVDPLAEAFPGATEIVP